MKSNPDNLTSTSTRLRATRPRWPRRGAPAFAVLSPNLVAFREEFSERNSTAEARWTPRKGGGGKAPRVSRLCRLCGGPRRGGAVSALLALALLAEPAHALFHLWDFNEIYSNEDGSVQFIEFFTAFANQESLATELLSVTDSFGTRTFTFPTNLPSGTAGKTFVVATDNLAFLPGGVRPDYVLTNAGPFLVGNSGSLTLVGAETVTFTNLPRDGVRSLGRSGAALSVIATNSPKNYFNASNSIVPVKFSSIARSGTNLLLSFATATGTNGTAGPNYKLLRLDDLNTTNASTLTNVTGDGTLKTVTAPITGPQGFFRLQVP